MKINYKRPKLINDFESIKEELQINNLNYLVADLKDDSRYLLIEKFISFADIPTSRKLQYLTSDKDLDDAFTKENIEKRNKANSAFYATYDEMNDWEWKHRKEKVFFCQTKQASIYVPTHFYRFLGVSDPTTRGNKVGCNWVESYQLINDNYNVYICNSSVEKYFGKELTQKTYDKLSRSADANDVELSDSNYTKLSSLTITPHGLGMQRKDGLFTKIRENLFAKDKVIFLLEETVDKKFNIYIAFYRNPKFFIINGIYNNDYLLAKYGEEQNNDDIQESRTGQAKWRDELAEYSISITAEDDDFVECPFTGVKVQYPSESAFLRASHIKAYSKCKLGNGKIDIAEAYDLNNGFLVIADVDALFDKYMITVDPNTSKIIKSPSLSNDVLNHLKLNTIIPEKYMTEKKKEYLQVHYAEFIKRNDISVNI